MDFSEIELSTRITLDDNTTGDRLWSQAEILEYAQDAENEAAERAGLLLDNSGAFTDISVNTSTALYTMSNTIVDVRSAIMALGTKELLRTTEKVLDLSYASWRSNTGTPRSYFVSATNEIRVYPQPIVVDTINMTVTRFPNTPMTINGSPEIQARDHPGLLEWILYRSYMKNDSETLNVDKALD
ncbi:hypothetical protein LCGC14_3152440, partial [marine sediment metagenome]